MKNKISRQKGEKGKYEVKCEVFNIKRPYDYCIKHCSKKICVRTTYIECAV